MSKIISGTYPLAYWTQAWYARLDDGVLSLPSFGGAQ
jgi:hypothetical protein